MFLLFYIWCKYSSLKPKDCICSLTLLKAIKIQDQILFQKKCGHLLPTCSYPWPPFPRGLEGGGVSGVLWTTACAAPPPAIFLPLCFIQKGRATLTNRRSWPPHLPPYRTSNRSEESGGIEQNTSLSTCSPVTVIRRCLGASLCCEVSLWKHLVRKPQSQAAESLRWFEVWGIVNLPGCYLPINRPERLSQRSPLLGKSPRSRLLFAGMKSRLRERLLSCARDAELIDPRGLLCDFNAGGRVSGSGGRVPLSRAKR